MRKNCSSITTYDSIASIFFNQNKNSVMKKIIVLFLVSFIAAANLHAQKKNLHVVKTFHIASGGGWDYLAVGPNNRLYVSHGTQVNVLDKTTGDSVGVIENTTGVHGI